MANQESAIQRAISKYGANSEEARAAYNAYVTSMVRANQRPQSRKRFGVK